jgi:hypothetical protein
LTAAGLAVLGGMTPDVLTYHDRDSQLSSVRARRFGPHKGHPIPTRAPVAARRGTRACLPLGRGRGRPPRNRGGERAPHRLEHSPNVAAATFDAQLRRLHGLGFETITLDQYVRFARHEAVDLPPRPVLITFDDGYVSAVEEADPVLARYGWTAVMYVPTATVGTPGRLTWGALRQMRSSGRWQIAEHAGDGHVLITVDSEGRRLPFYANEQWTNGKQESFAHYKRRVTTDIERGSAILARNLPGWTPHLSFAIPFGDYGQRGSNDRRIEPWLSDYLKTRFVVTFVQRDDSFTTPDPGFANRITVAANWNANTLESHLFLGLDRLTPVSARNRISPHSR